MSSASGAATVLRGEALRGVLIPPCKSRPKFVPLRHRSLFIVCCLFVFLLRDLGIAQGKDMHGRREGIVCSEVVARAVPDFKRLVHPS